MPYYQVLDDGNDDLVGIRDIAIPPFGSGSSSTSPRIARRSNVQDRYDEDFECYQIFPIAWMQKKNKKKKGILGWLGWGREEDPIISTRRVIEPQQLFFQAQSSTLSLGSRLYDMGHDHSMDILICILCKSSHQSTCFSTFTQGCCMCTGHGHIHVLCLYQRTRHDGHRHLSPHRRHNHNRHVRFKGFVYESSSDDGHEARHLRHHSHHRCRGQGRKTHRGPDPLSETKQAMRRRGERYKKSTEHEWREELINLMAEEREEISWEHHNMTAMPEVEKADFLYRDSEERKHRMDHLSELLEQSRAANLKRDRVRSRNRAE